MTFVVNGGIKQKREGGEKMKKLLLLCLSILLVCFSFVSTVLAQGLDNLELNKVICPVTVTAGTPLDVTVEVANEGPTPITITREAVVLSGNPVSSLGGTGVWGPFPRNVVKTISAYTSTSFTLRVVGSVPTSLKGKIAAVGVTILSDDPSEPNVPSDGGGCLVIVQ
jgi:hypothetical protein